MFVFVWYLKFLKVNFLAALTGEDGTVNTPQPPETPRPHGTSPPVRSTVRPPPTGDPGMLKY